MIKVQEKWFEKGKQKCRYVQCLLMWQLIDNIYVDRYRLHICQTSIAQDCRSQLIINSSVKSMGAVKLLRLEPFFSFFKRESVGGGGSCLYWSPGFGQS